MFLVMLLVVLTAHFFSTGYPASIHPFQPPFSAKTFVKPRFSSSSTTRALVASSTQEQ